MESSRTEKEGVAQDDLEAYNRPGIEVGWKTWWDIKEDSFKQSVLKWLMATLYSSSKKWQEKWINKILCFQLGDQKLLMKIHFITEIREKSVNFSIFYVSH